MELKKLSDKELHDEVIRLENIQAEIQRRDTEKKRREIGAKIFQESFKLERVCDDISPSFYDLWNNLESEFIRDFILDDEKYNYMLIMEARAKYLNEMKGEIISISREYDRIKEQYDNLTRGL